MMKSILPLAMLPALLVFAGHAAAQEPVVIKWSRAEIETRWEARIKSFLDRGVIPLVDLESSISEEQAKQLYQPAVHARMDALGIALIAFDANQAPQTPGGPQGYRWGYHMHAAVNAHPERFILSSNSGISPNWRQQREDMIAQTEAQVRSGTYPVMAEFEFRHFVSQGECREGRFDREVNIPLNAPNGHRLFALAAATGVSFLVHNEPEDAALAALEEMLRTYPAARVIQAHFGQIRYPERQQRFTAQYARHLLSTYPNLHFDISVGEPGRRYQCQGQNLIDTVLWESSGSGQRDMLKPEYKVLLSEFSDRFVAGMDYGGGRPPLVQFWEGRVKNLRLILRDLPVEAQHRIAYGNAWRLLTGRAFK